MKTRHYILLASLVALLTACIPSVNSFYEDKDLVSDNHLAGEWQFKEDPGAPDSQLWKFEEAGKGTYKLMVDDNSGKHGEFSAHLFKLKEKLFLDVIPTKVDFATNQIDQVACAIFPGHLLIFVPELDSSLKVAFMDYDWLKKYLDEHSSELAHHKEQDDEILLTASTPKLQKFVLKHFKEMFGKQNELVHKTSK
jgi:hypothetical protein